MSVNNERSPLLDGGINVYGTQKHTRSGTRQFDAAEPSKMAKLGARIKGLEVVATINAAVPETPNKADPKSKRSSYEKVDGKVSKDGGELAPKGTYQA
ncbi:MAG: hypothetical protein S4CHLAM2_06090 [Chlamydiales bacterium]|nr:hypothetical protein [Chlamydiales bacterium]